jgi:hypothetical protein
VPSGAASLWPILFCIQRQSVSDCITARGRELGYLTLNIGAGGGAVNRMKVVDVRAEETKTRH